MRNLPPVLKFVWDSSPVVVALGFAFRLLAALQPVALLYVSKLIIDAIVAILSKHQPIPHRLWWLVAAEFAIAVLGNILTRIIDYLDSLLADKYMRYVSIQVMRHAAELDLIAYEDPVFYDRLERARVQATDRLAMIQMLGRLVQQVITTITLSVSIVYFSPWLLLLLIAGVLPAFVGESHFAFLGYAKNFRQTPVRRQLDYLRVLGGSKEAAKELKLFGLSKFLTDRFTRLSDEVYEENVALSKRKLIAGGFLSIIGSLGYYSAYVYVIWRTVMGALSIGSLYFLAGAILQASANIQQIFSTLSGVADQVPDRPAGVFRDAAHHPLQAKCAPGAAAHPARIRIPQRLVRLSRQRAANSEQLGLHVAPRRTGSIDRRERARQNHRRQTDYPALRSHRGTDPARWHRSARVQPGRSLS